MSHPPRLAVVGLGMALKPHAQALIDLQAANEVTVATAWSPTAARREDAHKAYGFPIAGDFDTIVSDSTIDAVLLLTPADARQAFVERLAKAGKPILMEKPVERTTDAAQRLVETCENAGIALGIVLQYRFRPIVAKLRAFLDQGVLGDLAMVQLSIPWWRPQSYYDQPGRGTLAKDGGGVLITQAIHAIDLMLSLTGPVASVAAIAGTSTLHRMETEDTVGAGLRFANGAIGGLFATTAAYPGAGDFLTLSGTKASATIDAGALTIAWHDGRRERFEGETRSGGGADPMAFSHEAHRALIQDFLHAIRDNRDPAITGRDALGAHRLIDALLRSSQEGRAIAP
jgi:predicted dehydrogenase